MLGSVEFIWDCNKVMEISLQGNNSLALKAFMYFKKQSKYRQ